MWDKDLVKKDYMGEVAVPLGQWFSEGNVAWDDQNAQGARSFELVSARRRRRVTGRVFLQFGLILPDDVPNGEREARAREIVQSLESKGERHMACLMDVPAVSPPHPLQGPALILWLSTKASAPSKSNAIEKNARNAPKSQAGSRNQRR